MRKLIAAWVISLPLALAGCGDDGGSASDEESTTDPSESSTGDPGVDFETDIQPIFNASCTCHLQGPTGMMTAPFMTLNEGMSYGEIFNVASEQAPGLSRVSPDGTEGSYLWHKINSTHMDVGGIGTAMPPALPLDEESIAMIEAWIVGGALP